jgi:hypothetical protein
MFCTLHAKDKPVFLSVRRLKNCSGVSEFNPNSFELLVEAQDKSFCFVGYLSPAELDSLGESIKQELFDLSLERINCNEN